MKSFTKRLCAIVVAFVLSLSMMSTLVACGSLGLTSIVVVESSIATQYYVGDTVSFDGIKIKANYNDGTEEELKLSDVKVLLNDEDITSNLSKITETKGNKTVVISYENQTASIAIKVTERAITPGPGEDPGEPSEPEAIGNVLSYALPLSYSGYETKTKAAYAGALAYGEQGFESQFTTGDETAKDYLVGDDNIFRFIPRLRYQDYSDEELKFASTFPSVTTIKYNGANLETRTGTIDNTIEYYLDDVPMVTAYTYKNEYQFSAQAVGKQFELSIDPVDGYFDWETITKASVTATVNVVDGYNIYEAYQLAVIDNSQTEWNIIKTAKSLENINPNAIIFQNDITVTTADIPAAFTYTLDQEVKYIDRNGDTVIGSSTFLYDGIDIIKRVVDDGTSLNIYGNYHTLDLQQLPLVCSFKNRTSDGFGFDGSNTTFFALRGNYTNSDNFGTVFFNNLAVSGNANVDPLKNHADNGGLPEEADLPVYCGGIIFSKTSYIGATYSNFNVHKTFIPFFPDDVSGYDNQTQDYPVVIKDCKAYDSLNNAIFTYGRTKLDIINSVMERAGGPLILSQVQQPETYGALRAPIVTVDNASILNNFVKGDEFWFESKGANEIVASLQPLDYHFAPFGRKMFNNDSKLNLIYALMPSGGVETIGLWQTQGFFSYKGTALDRIYTDPTNHPFGYQTAGVLATAANASAIGACFTAGSSFGYMLDDYNSVFVNPNLTVNIPDLKQNPQNYAGYATSGSGFATSNYIALNYGGFGLFFEFFQA